MNKDVPMTVRFGYTILYVPDVRSTIAFYEAAFGLTPRFLHESNLYGVVCGRGRNPTLRFRPSVFAGEIDVLPAERRDMGQEIGR